LSSALFGQLYLIHDRTFSEIPLSSDTPRPNLPSRNGPTRLGMTHILNTYITIGTIPVRQGTQTEVSRVVGPVNPRQSKIPITNALRSVPGMSLIELPRNDRNGLMEVTQGHCLFYFQKKICLYWRRFLVLVGVWKNVRTILYSFIIASRFVPRGK
jgi:hypothetical protein